MTDPGMDTPLAPLDEPAQAAQAPRRKGRVPRRRQGALADRPARSPRAAGTPGAAMRWGLGYALGARRALLFILLAQLLLALTVVMPFWSGIAPYLDEHVHAGALAGSPDAHDRALGWEAGMDPGIWRDIQREEESLFEGLTLVHFWVAVVAWLFGALVAGGILGTVVGGDRPVRVGTFLTAGAKHYGRMLRVGLVFGVAYYVCARLVFEAWGGSVQIDEFMAPSEGAGWWGGRLREAVFVLLFLWFRLAADLARARLFVRAKRSAVAAFFRSLFPALRLRYLGTATLLGLPLFLLLLLLSFAARALTGDGWVVLVLLFFTFELAVLVRWISRAAVLAGFAHIVEHAREGPRF